MRSSMEEYLQSDLENNQVPGDAAIDHDKKWSDINPNDALKSPMASVDGEEEPLATMIERRKRKCATTVDILISDLDLSSESNE